MPIKPAIYATTKDDLRPSDQYHREDQQREHVEQVELSGKVIDAKGAHVEHNHRDHINRSDKSMKSGSLGIEQDASAEKEASDAGNEMHEMEHDQFGR